MNLKTILVALLMSSVALAGCTDGNEGTDAGETPEEDPNKGAISGLLVDDNFRPVQLKEEWSTEPGDYQDRGFILLVETAERLHSNENGEFEAAGLDPGRYTLRVAAEGHEAIEEKVDVEASKKESVTLEARRKASDSNPILTIEFSGFVPCATGGLLAVTGDCSTDFSGDTYRPGPLEDYRTPYGTDVHYMVIEAVTSQPGDYSLVFREDDATGSGGREFGEGLLKDENMDNPYMKLILENSAVYGTQVPEADRPVGATHANYYTPEHNPRFKGQNEGEMICGPSGQDEDDDATDYCSWPNAFPESDETFNDMEALVFYWGEGAVGTVPPTGPDGGPTLCPNECGVGYGAKVAVRVNYVISIFIGEPTVKDSSPEDDLNDYCVICDGYLDDQ